jgi:hypothetical protein
MSYLERRGSTLTRHFEPTSPVREVKCGAKTSPLAGLVARVQCAGEG